MTSEVPATPEPAAQPAVEQPTPPAQAEAVPAPEQTKPQEPDWRAAYVGLQRNLDRSQKRTEDVLKQNSELLGAIKVLQGDTTELVRSTLGEDKAREMAARNAQSMAQEAARRAATAAQNLAQAQANVILGALQAAGIDPRDPAIDWANDATDVESWQARVIPSVQARIQKATEARLAHERETITAKSKAEIKAEAEALASRAVKELGVDRIDTAKGQSSTNLIDRIRSLKPGTEEYRRFEAEVARGTVKT